MSAGLHSRFLSEVRTWTDTFQAYQEGLKTGFFKNISWADEIIQKLPLKSEETRESFGWEVLKFLSPNFHDPEEEFYQLPLVKDSLQTLRKDYECGKKSAFIFDQK